ncbi:probable ATP-dependent RNA helicase Dbp73D [Culex quinquefasciatus]|uniref:probable ATP-dependent RNA helicase Dbp73D n=1 Tax=Culex quinquefasciatus TaxID=7176 RepID=UPI0018E3A35E|nr:probable ATP-dependent RNA helicase Dbp73D [Culex quinquefasciatus]
MLEINNKQLSMCGANRANAPNAAQKLCLVSLYWLDLVIAQNSKTTNGSSDYSIDGSHRLSFVLHKIFGTVLVIEEWSSSLSLQARMSVLCRFALRKVNGIICTDTLGCSIDDIDVVISYEIDQIGRTSRAGNRVPSSRC